MAEDKEKKKLLKKLRNKYRLIIYNDVTLEEVWHMRLSRLNVFTSIGVSAVLLTAMIIVLIAFTPLKEYIPGYPDGNLQKTILTNSLKLDSIQKVVESRNRYLINLKRIMSGQIDSLDANQIDSIVYSDTLDDQDRIVFETSEEDSILRQQVAEADLYNLSVLTDESSNKGLSQMHMLPPIKGMVVNHFNSSEKHYGIDVVSSPNEGIMTILDGTVLLATWTYETGYVIQVQHENNLISIYKHNSALLKKEGDQVKAGEVVAIVGNTGELTTGPHLHFELWHNGSPLNPEDYIVF